VSTTLDWQIAHGICADFPLLMGTDTVTPPRIHLLRYDVAVDRVAYVPLLANLALETLDPGAATGRSPTDTATACRSRSASTLPGGSRR
jgi:hypothetical protein